MEFTIANTKNRPDKLTGVVPTGNVVENIKIDHDGNTHVEVLREANTYSLKYSFHPVADSIPVEVPGNHTVYANRHDPLGLDLF